MSYKQNLKETFQVGTLISIPLLIVTVVFLLVAIAGGFYELWWYPYEMRMKNEMIQNSPGYSQTKVEEMRNYIQGYYNTNSGRQKKGVLITVCGDANDVRFRLPHDVSNFVNTHCQ